MWKETYQSKGYSKLPEFERGAKDVQAFDGVSYRHPGGARLGFGNWDFPRLKSALWINGTLSDNSDRDRGWRVELALPWVGLTQLAGQGSLPPREGDLWWMDFSRFNRYKEAAPAVDSSGWAWSPHFVWDSHIPECLLRWSLQCNC